MRICLLGATGSVGSSAAAILSSQAKFQVTALAAATNLSKLLEQWRQFKPEHIVLADQAGYDKFAELLQQQGVADAPQLLVGESGIQQAIDSSDWVINALSGTNGLIASIQALSAGKKLLLANKESLVAAGDLLLKLSRQHKSEILSLDSEHNAIMRCLPSGYKIGEPVRDYGVKHLWLTASGGPFLHHTAAQMQEVSAADACRHPTWSMGSKISIDSATMMNKGLEIIEACRLFNLKQEDVKVVIHPQSIVHCLVEYNDGSMVAQLSKPDMKITIQQALHHPDYVPLPPSEAQPLDPLSMGELEFMPPPNDKFPCLQLARRAGLAGGIMPCVLSIADDLATEAFLAGKISFIEIATVIEKVMDVYTKEPIADFPGDLDTIKFLSQDIATISNAII